MVLKFWETSSSNHKQVRHSRESNQWNQDLAETKSPGQGLISSLRVESMKKSQSRLEKQTRNRHVILTPRRARIPQEQKLMMEGLSWCNQGLVRGGTEQDGWTSNTSAIFLSICVVPHTPNRCQEDKWAAGTYQVYWIFIAPLARESVTLGSTLNSPSQRLPLFKAMVMRVGRRSVGEPRMEAEDITIAPSSFPFPACHAELSRY